MKFGKNMSRVGKKPILIPGGVEVKIDGRKVTVKGPKGQLSQGFRKEIKVEIEDNKVFVRPDLDTKRTNAFWGLTRALINNLIEGVVSGFEKKLEINGIGYKANLEGKDLVLKVGFSHLVNIQCPEGIEFKVEKNVITISGINKQLVGQTAAKIRKVRPPEPYKGKGIKYVDEIIRRKVGKKAAGETA